MKNPKNKRAVILSIILVGLLILAYKVMFVPSGGSEDLFVEENISASERVENTLQQVENINFDTSVIQDQRFKSLKSLETPLISLPVGKKNPFSASSN